MSQKTPKATDLVYTKARGGKKPLWHARHPNPDTLTPDANGITGAANSADNAGRDWQKQYRAHEKNTYTLNGKTYKVGE